MTVHGDFRLGNFPGRPRLARHARQLRSSPTRRPRGRGHRIAVRARLDALRQERQRFRVRLPMEELLGRTAAAGAARSTATVRSWQIHATMKSAIICSLQAFRTSARSTIQSLAAIGRQPRGGRTCSRCSAWRRATLPEPSPRATQWLRSRPTGADFIDVRQYLDDVIDAAMAACASSSRSARAALRCVRRGCCSAGTSSPPTRYRSTTSGSSTTPRWQQPSGPRLRRQMGPVAATCATSARDQFVAEALPLARRHNVHVEGYRRGIGVYRAAGTMPLRHPRAGRLHHEDPGVVEDSDGGTGPVADPEDRDEQAAPRRPRSGGSSIQRGPWRSAAGQKGGSRHRGGEHRDRAAPPSELRVRRPPDQAQRRRRSSPHPQRTTNGADNRRTARRPAGKAVAGGRGVVNGTRTGACRPVSRAARPRAPTLRKVAAEEDQRLTSARAAAPCRINDRYEIGFRWTGAAP